MPISRWLAGRAPATCRGSVMRPPGTARLSAPSLSPFPSALSRASSSQATAEPSSGARTADNAADERSHLVRRKAPRDAYWKDKYGRKRLQETDGSNGSPQQPRDNATYWKNKYGPKRVQEIDGSNDSPPKSSRRARKAASKPKAKNAHGIGLNLTKQSLDILEKTTFKAEKDGLLHSGEHSGKHVDSVPVELARFQRWRLDPADAEQRCIELQELREVAQSADTKVILPMNEYATEVRHMVAYNQFCTIVGETGSGKTTQVPQILLDEAVDQGMGTAVNIICTQPRRIAATSVAKRVAEERLETLGQSVGYHIRHEAELPQYGGSITYCTTGILLKQLQSPDEVLDGFSHIILDEVHERDINLDFVLIMLKRAFIERARVGNPVPKLILMSATIDTAIFQDYFADPRLGDLAAQCPALHVPGRTFPVTRHYVTDIVETLANAPGHLAPLGDNSFATNWIKTENDPESEGAPGFPPKKLFLALIAHLVSSTDSGAILVFLPGMGEIRDIMELLLEEKPLGIDFRDTTKFRLLQLHSLIEQDQRTVFDESPPGVRKIILSTNIAETSVTIPDVTIVLDSGLIRRMEYDPIYRRSELKMVFVSQSNLNQRAGRAGRVQAGDYYGIFNEERVEKLPQLPVPEMRLANLADLCLTIKAQRNPTPIADFLSDAVEPPEQKAVVAAVRDLTDLGAITADENITPLGRVLARLPLDPAFGKLVIMGILFECLDPIIILGGAADSNPWERGTLETEQAAHRSRWEFTEGTFSEHLALLHAYRDLRAAVRKNPGLDTHHWCRQKYLRPFAIHHIEHSGTQVEGILVEAGLVPRTTVGKARSRRLFSNTFGPAHLNTNSNNERLVRAVLAAGTQPNMAWNTTRGHATPHAGKLVVAKSWANMLPRGSKSKPKIMTDFMPILLFEELMYSARSEKTSMSTVTPVSPLVAALFGDRPRVPTEADTEWMELRKVAQVAGNLVFGRKNPNMPDDKVPRLLISIHCDGDAEGEVLARDALVRFRLALDQGLDRALQKLTHNQAVSEDPAWQLFAEAVVDLVDADDWDGLEKAMELMMAHVYAKDD